MGVIAAGMGRLATPFKSFTAKTAAERDEKPLPLAATTFSAAFEVFFSAAAFGFGLLAEVATAFFFLSPRARVSASHAAFALPPREAFLPLCHSAESSAPAICAIVLPLRIE